MTRSNRSFTLSRVRDARLLRHWRSSDALEAARRVAGQVAPGAELLPLTRITESVVFPLVVWDTQALGVRSQNRVGALTRLGDLQDLLARPDCDDSCPVPLRIHGFISPLRPEVADAQLSGLRGMGRTIVVVPAEFEVSGQTMTSLDLQGTALFRDDLHPELLVPGDSGPMRGSRYNDVFLRLRQEQLFGLAALAD